MDRSVARCALAMIAALGCSPVAAQERPDLAPAERFVFDRIGETVANADIVTHWIAGRDSLWYKRTEANGDKAFVLVDAASGRVKPAFDHVLLARGLSAILQRPIAAKALPFDDFRYSGDGKSLTLELGGKRLRCAIATGTCDTLPSALGESVSPDGRWIAFVRDHNLWVRPADGGRHSR